MKHWPLIRHARALWLVWNFTWRSVRMGADTIEDVNRMSPREFERAQQIWEGREP